MSDRTPPERQYSDMSAHELLDMAQQERNRDEAMILVTAALTQAVMNIDWTIGKHVFHR